METDPEAARAFLDALARLDFDALEAVLDPAVRFRALVPGESIAVGTDKETAGCFRRWFGELTDFEIIDRRVETLVDTLRFEFRARVGKRGAPYLIAQSMCGELEDGRFATLDLLCAGFRPEAAEPSNGTMHPFDAGDLGCSSGLPKEFRTRIAQIPVGHVLQVVTSDAASKEDLPSMAGLLGHQVRSVEPGADGKIRIEVERMK